MRIPSLRKSLCGLLLFSLTLTGFCLSTEEEIRLGQQAAAKFEQQHGLVNDPALVGRLRRVSQKLLKNAKRKDLPWTFKIINVNEFNAAAFPGGYIYATKGLMQGLNEEELAFVIGHEVGHVDNRHSIKQIESAQLRRIGLIAILAGTGAGENAQTLAGLADGVIGSQRSQGDEAESDRYGLEMMGLAGYDPAFALSALQKLASQSGGGTPGFLNTLLGSHPLPKERVEQGERLLMTVPFRPEASAPVVSSNSVEDFVYDDATAALEYTLSLLGHGRRDSLMRAAKDHALGKRAAPGGTRKILFETPTSEGMAGVERRLFENPMLKQRSAFGVSVVDTGNGNVRTVVLFQGGM